MKPNPHTLDMDRCRFCGEYVSHINKRLSVCNKHEATPGCRAAQEGKQAQDRGLRRASLMVVRLLSSDDAEAVGGERIKDRYRRGTYGRASTYQENLYVPDWIEEIFGCEDRGLGEAPSYGYKALDVLRLALVAAVDDTELRDILHTTRKLGGYQQMIEKANTYAKERLEQWNRRKYAKVESSVLGALRRSRKAS